MSLPHFAGQKYILLKILTILRKKKKKYVDVYRKLIWTPLTTYEKQGTRHLILYDVWVEIPRLVLNWIC